MWDSPGYNFTSCRHWKSQAKDSITAEVMGTSQFHSEKVDLKSISRVVQVTSPCLQHVPAYTVLFLVDIFLLTSHLSILVPLQTGFPAPSSDCMWWPCPRQQLQPQGYQALQPPSPTLTSVPTFPMRDIDALSAAVAGLTPNWWLFPEDAERRRKLFSESSQPVWYFPFLEIENCRLS